ncbi:AEC family transporter [bacterium]|nr:AEC family transporter [bacterium]
MTSEATFTLMAACIYLPLGVGYATRRIGLLHADASKPISRAVLVTFEAFVCLMGAWHLDVSEPGRALLVPLIGAAVTLGLLGAGLLVAPLFHHQPRQRGAFLVCALMSNIGMSLGGFLCYAMFGMPGQSLAVTYMAHFLPVALLVGMMIATYHTTGAHTTVRATVGSMARNPVVMAPLVCLVAGLALNIAGARSAPWLSTANGVAVYLVVLLHSFAIGLTLRLRRLATYWREAAALVGVKFVFGPLWGVALVWMLGQWGAFDGLLWRVVLIEGAMPVAIFATIVCNLFDLDRDLANTTWVITTFACAALIPVLYVLTA